ncbi:EamA family transporter [Comamonas sp.]|uniref:DMT family transporter n=1 Tax=Comamonas sp. TaxID=34028 RepID=UPI00289CDB80|nr:EamA family transporter [Comamonas sp.]
MRTERWGLAALLAVTVVWGTTFPAMKQLTADLSALHIIWLRFGMAAVVLLPLWLGMRRAELRWGLGLGVLNFVAFWLQIEGLSQTSSNRNAFVTGLNVLIVPLIAWLALRRRMGWNIWAACALAVAGMCLMFFEDAPWNWGDTLTLCSAVVYAIYILTMEAAALRNQAAPLRAPRMAAALAASMWACTTLMLLIQPQGMAQLYAQASALSSSGWVAMVYLGLIASAMVVVFQAWGQQHVDAMRSAIVFGLEPVFAALTAWWLIDERMGLTALCGAALMVVALIFSQWSPPPSLRARQRVTGRVNTSTT